ncbi:MAG: tetratricopeptide repeat protein [Scytonema sp. PMC 1069.18]|nr:tetratricopeptide repeat protein [Scytonema sp. PMC 1069.18]MEC4881507.1 tetratricopeptide repeat protein [Scytonema sp. PMC 1070.18]
MRKHIVPPASLVTLPGLASVAVTQPAQASYSWEYTFDKDIKTFQNSTSSAGNELTAVVVAVGIALALSSTACIAYRHLNQGRFSLSIPNSQQKAKEEPEETQTPITLGNKQIAAAYIEKAYVALRQGDVKRAIAQLNHAITVHPHNAYLYTERANFRRKNLADPLGALEDYTQAINLHPDNAFFYLWRSQVYHELGEMLQAMTDYNTALRLAPEDTMYHLVQPNLQSARG